MQFCYIYILLFIATVTFDVAALLVSPTLWNHRSTTGRLNNAVTSNTCSRTTLLFLATPVGADDPLQHNDGEDDFEEEEEEDDDDDDIQPYGNRSLSWTKRYRKLNSYEQCRQRVIQFGHRNKKDWDEAVSSGQLGAYVPNRPDEMYATEWVSWDEWLGLMRSYEETRHLAVNVLGLKSLDDYIIFVRQNPKRAEGLRIPVRPDIKYKEEWISEKDFFQQQKMK